MTWKQGCSLVALAAGTPAAAAVAVFEATGDPALARWVAGCVAVVALFGAVAALLQPALPTWLQHRTEYRIARDEGRERRRVTRAATRSWIPRGGSEAVVKLRRDARAYAKDRGWRGPTAMVDVMRATRDRGGTVRRTRSGTARKSGNVTELENKRRASGDTSTGPSR
ncbi:MULTISPECIES: hypothetical protein [unclassified Actinomadura]|uniref:hypothetical protein n=1 Tax=unclassified Actinomadura TaxID=2626254 RepID=UPI0011F034D4|nr:hypothetical protein [Actinomadura sp. K4S16]